MLRIRAVTSQAFLFISRNKARAHFSTGHLKGNSLFSLFLFTRRPWDQKEAYFHWKTGMRYHKNYIIQLNSHTASYTHTHTHIYIYIIIILFKKSPWLDLLSSFSHILLDDNDQIESSLIYIIMHELVQIVLYNTMMVSGAKRWIVFCRCTDLTTSLLGL